MSSRPIRFYYFLGRQVSFMAHLAGNLLAELIGYLQLIEASSSDPARIRKYAARTVALAFEMKRMLDWIVSLSVSPSGSKPECSPVSVVDHVLEIANLMGAGSHRVYSGVSAGDTTLRISAPQLEGALLNLVINSMQSMESGKAIVVSCEIRDVSLAEVAEWSHAAPRKNMRPRLFALFSICDEGPGMDPSLIDEVLHTGSRRRSGRGFGIPSVVSFASEQNGFVAIESTPGRGTTVRIALPADKQESLSTQTDRAA